VTVTMVSAIGVHSTMHLRGACSLMRKYVNNASRRLLTPHVRIHIQRPYVRRTALREGASPCRSLFRLETFADGCSDIQKTENYFYELEYANEGRIVGCFFNNNSKHREKLLQFLVESLLNSINSSAYKSLVLTSGAESDEGLRVPPDHHSVTGARHRQSAEDVH